MRSQKSNPVAPPYTGVGKQMILRDHLAIDRTRLANERTLLSWYRTALMMLVSGITLLKLFEGVLAMELLGGLLMPLSLWVAFWGSRRYLQTRKSIQTAIDR